MTSWVNPRISLRWYKRREWVAWSTRTTKEMASEVFHVIFSAHFEAHHDESNEACLRWWINEKICDFIMPSYLCGDPPQPCTMQHEGHHPKVLLWVMEEFFYILHGLTDEDHDGCIVLGYELMLEVEHRFRIKWGRGIRCHWSPSHSASNAPPCSPETLDHITWLNPDSKMLERLEWSIYDGILTPGPMPKLVGPESYNQVTRHLAAKAFQGLQVCCPVRTSMQFDEPSLPKLRSVVFMPPCVRAPRNLRPWTLPPWRMNMLRKGLWEVKETLTQTNMHWPGCVSASMGMLMNRLIFVPCSIRWWMGVKSRPVSWHASFCQHGTGLLPPIQCHDLPPQPIWKLEDGCHWTGRGK